MKQLKRKQVDYSMLVKNLHEPKPSKELKKELQILRNKLEANKPRDKLEKPIDYLHRGRNR